MHEQDNYCTACVPKRQRYSRMVSNAFHPLLIPVYSLLLFYSISFMQFEKAGFLLACLLCTIFFSVLIPLASLKALHAKGLISGMDIPRREDRVIPYLICAAFLTLCSIVLNLCGMFGFVYGSLYAGSVSIIVCALVNFWWKISIHSAAMGCWLGCVLHTWTCFPLCYYARHNALVIAALVLVSGGVLSARIASGQHSQAQVYAGFALGLLVGYGVLGLFWVD